MSETQVLVVVVLDVKLLSWIDAIEFPSFNVATFGEAEILGIFMILLFFVTDLKACI
jgi:hypothetical protein